MPIEISQTFLRRLIEIGQSHNFSDLQQLFKEFPLAGVGHYMRQSPEFWNAIADSLSDAELEALIRGITVAERDFPSFGGGSVSGVIWTYRCLEHRKQGKLDALADWILAHTQNEYVPFGRNNGGARSLAELNAFHQRVAERRASRETAEVERHEIASERKAEKATLDIFSAIRRNDVKAVQALLLRGARLDVQNAAGMTALTYAQTLGHPRILELLQTSK